MVSRGVGVVLLILAVSSVLSWPLFYSSGVAVSGWTSYSPLGTNAPSGMITVIEPAAVDLSHWLPPAAEGIAGLILILFSRPIGAWLAGGLRGGDSKADN